MVEEQRWEADDAMRRFLADLRSGVDRRSGRDRRDGQRRGDGTLTAGERRRVDRRAGPDRRAGAERRQPLAAQFSLKDTEHIREMLDSGVDAACPRCRGNLLLGPLTQEQGLLLQEVHCTTCRHNAMLVREE